MEPRRPLTLEDVARAAGVSKTTASVVLNGQASTFRISEATRTRVMDVADRLGYVPDHAARSLRRRRTGVITLLLWRLGSPLFSEIATGVGLVAGREEYQVNVVDAHGLDAELRALQHVRQGSADGVIIAVNRHYARGPALESLSRLIERGLPAVILLDHSPHPRIPSIRVDDDRGGYLATRHLLDLGHRRIAHVAWDDIPLLSDEPDAGIARFRAYRRALADAGIVPEPSWVVTGPRGIVGGRELAHRFLAAHPDPATRPTAVFASNDLIALGCLRGFYEAGVRVPEDVALVGFHGVELGSLTTPALTTVEHGSTELGRLGAETLINLVNGADSAPVDRVLPVRLLVRESCGAARRAGDPGETIDRIDREVRLGTIPACAPHGAHDN